MVEIFKALAEESRLRILSLLFQDDLCVCELEDCLGLKQSNISRHLSVLRHCGLVENYKQAQWAFYRINGAFMQEHRELATYLSENLKGLPSFQVDIDRIRECKLDGKCKAGAIKC